MNEILQKRIKEAAKRYAWSHDTIGVDKETFHTEASQKHSIPIHKEVRVPIQQEMEVAFKCAAHFILKNQWISVGEALPEKNTMCFVRKETEVGVIYDADYIDYEGKWFFNFNRASIKSMVITHWMMIPTINNEEK